ncbi:hypothetical protein D5F01_LYC24345 [Larimichthys crocea]|uniref:PiggyBac transposable element-derived protein domain-containing protein n=1 Tax=Larimichthys crocea TaxID=215358 RepID=A0A6G0HEJ6_LARCR|nr:hypothetical protein D5F01_LYC24345 [Larimichthys crocea]
MPIIAEMKRRFRQDFFDRYVELQELLNSASALDPRFKDLTFLDDVDSRDLIFVKITAEVMKGIGALDEGGALDDGGALDEGGAAEGGGDRSPSIEERRDDDVLPSPKKKTAMDQLFGEFVTTRTPMKTTREKAKDEMSGPDDELFAPADGRNHPAYPGRNKPPRETGDHRLARPGRGGAAGVHGPDYFGRCLPVKRRIHSQPPVEREEWAGHFQGHDVPQTMFHHIGRALRFDDKLSRPRRQDDKLAAFRQVWDMWTHRLPMLFNPDRDICVNEQLVPFKGRCRFRQYMPKKPAKYGLKIWATCDVKTSYAWRLQVYTGKEGGRPAEINQGMRVVLEMMEGLQGNVITCDNFFTSFGLSEELLRRKLALVGTIRRNKPELPRHLLQAKVREVFSSLTKTELQNSATTEKKCFLPTTKQRGKNVLLLSTKHRDPHVSDDAKRKPTIIQDYNRCKGGVDNLDKQKAHRRRLFIEEVGDALVIPHMQKRERLLRSSAAAALVAEVVGTYSCRRQTNRWPLALFHNLIDVSLYNAFVLWTSIEPSWEQQKAHSLVLPL